MSRRLDRDVRKWLEAQRDGSDDVAERALMGVFAELGRRHPRAGFTDRVLLRTGRLPPASPWRWWLRGVVAACLVAAGLAVAILPAWLPVVRSLAHAFAWPAVSAVSHWGGHWIAGAVALWRVIGDVATAVRASLATPTAVVLLAANVLLAAASLVGLRRLLKAPEELTPW